MLKAGFTPVIASMMNILRAIVEYNRTMLVCQFVQAKLFALLSRDTSWPLWGDSGNARSTAVTP
jgi:hypothetical protein